MGNTVSEDINKSNQRYIYEIFNYPCNVLYIENKQGSTGYIDFIKQTDTYKNTIMKGIDISNRKFIVVKAEYVYENGEIVETFSTFFQRYPTNETLWHCCGHDGRILMDTCGGMSNEQFRFLHDLLYYAEIQLTKETIETLKLYIPLNNDYEIYGINDTKYPIYIKLGYSTNK
jgi:hypothetical protein